MTRSRHRQARQRLAAGAAAFVSGRLPLAFEPLESRSLLAACCGVPPDGGVPDAVVAELDVPVAMPEYVVGFAVNGAIDPPVAVAWDAIDPLVDPFGTVSLAVAGGVPGDDLESAALWQLADEPMLDVQLLDEPAPVAATFEGRGDPGAFDLLGSTVDSAVTVVGPVPAGPEPATAPASSRQVTQPPETFRLPVGMAAAFGFGVPGTEATSFTPVGGRRRGR
jgi:hypothetical protein